MPKPTVRQFLRLSLGFCLRTRRPSRLLRGRWGRSSLTGLYFVAKGNGGAGLELLIVLIAHGLFDPLVEFREVERGVGDGVRWEPVLAVYLLPVGLELRVRIALLEDARAAPVALDDLQVPVVHPDDAFEVALAGVHL